MNLINHDMEYEKKLIEILGYNLVKSNSANVWNITDANDKEVGFIKYNKIYKRNKKLNLPESYAYTMVIDDDNILYKKLRRTTDEYGNLINNDFSYEFDLKSKNEHINHIAFNVGKYPYLEILSNDYGYMCLRLDFERLYLNYRSKTDNFNVEETLVFKTEEENIYNHSKEYSYVISYCDKSIDISDEKGKGIKTREITGVSTVNEQEHNLLKIYEKSWINHKIRIDKENIVTGSVEDMIIKHKIGIESFNHFRYLINKILPFKEEVITTLLKESGGNKNVTKIFSPDLNIDEFNKGEQKVKK